MSDRGPLTEQEVRTLAVELVMRAHTAILDCRESLVVEWVTQLQDGDARRVLLTVAMVAGLMAELAPGEARTRALATFLTVPADSSRTGGTEHTQQRTSDARDRRMSSPMQPPAPSTRDPQE